MKAKLFLSFVSSMFTISLLFAQPYVEGGNTRHRFAQLNLGFDVKGFSKLGSESFFYNDFGDLESFELNDFYQSRIIIGGTHFWGHADFLIAIPIIESKGNEFSSGVETTFRYYPWRIENHKIRPFVGLSVMNSNFKQGMGTKHIRWKFPLSGGFTFNHKKNLVEVSLGYTHRNVHEYYINPTEKFTIRTQAVSLSVGYKIMLDNTLGAEKDWLSGRTKLLTDTLAKLKRLDGFTLAFGPSSAFFTSKSSHTTLVAPYADQQKIPNVFLEYGLGYYTHKADLQLNLAFRTNKSTISAYDYKQDVRRSSLTFEMYKFLTDFHGFAIFLGPSINYENLKVQEKLPNQPESTSSKELIRPGVTFGWDIRPNRIQSFYLRTNLRWHPKLDVSMSSGKNVRLDQLEFNFIQLVVFPGRMF
jgi:hypothetical protein